MQEEKGCVYFFRHVGLSPVKIGYSENESPIKRFEQFKTYAPFGAELIGFIRTLRAKNLEKELHNKYSRDRIKGEWFEITKEEAERCILFYSNIEDIEEINNFQVSFAKYIGKRINIDADFPFFKYFDIIESEKTKRVVLNQSEIASILNTEKHIVKKFLNENNFILKSYNVSGIYKKGYRLNKLI